MVRQFYDNIILVKIFSGMSEDYALVGIIISLYSFEFMAGVQLYERTQKRYLGDHCCCGDLGAGATLLQAA